MHRVQGTITGFPPNTGYNYCQKLKLPVDAIQGFPVLGRPWFQGGLKSRVPTPRDFRHRSPLGVENSKSTRSKHLF
jgi:hypothetical protein